MDEMNETIQAETRDFQLEGLLERVKKASGPGGGEGGRRLACHRDKGVPSWIHGDEQCLERTLLHLLSFLSRQVEETDFLLSTTLEHQTFDSVLVRFEFGLKEGSSVTVLPESRGDLDLGMAGSLVRSMGGEMEGSFPQSGAAVLRFWVPFALPSQDPGSLETSPPSLRRRILLAEDNRVTQLATRKLLERRGHEVHVADNGREAVEKVTATPFDVVLMDLEMPGLNGISAAAAIRSMGIGGLPIVAYTVHTLPEDRRRCDQAGVDGFLAKPVSVTDLFREVERWPRRCDA
jgi:CheY-like chemotaxis protein